MLYYTIFIVFSALFSLGCGQDKSVDTRKMPIIEPEVQLNPPHTKKVNKWILPESWGEPSLAIDFSGKQLLLEDSRVHEVHKRQFPIIVEEYVLWRVKHLGSCWVYSGMAQFFYQAIEAGPTKFAELQAQIGKIFEQGAYLPNNKTIADDFLSILELVGQKMEHRFTLDVINHENVGTALESGFRRLLSIIFRSKGMEKYADEIEKPESWGSASDFGSLFHEIGIKYAEVSSDGKFGRAPTRSYFKLGDYLTGREAISIVWNGDREKFASIRKDMPVVMSFRSKPGYMDVAVLKSFSDRINKR